MKGPTIDAKIAARDVLAARLEARRPARLVMANGLFDLLHVGHVRYLEAAREAGDYLVVAVNDDASARALKGPLRPILPLGERLALLAALRAVDAVTWFPETTAAPTLRALKPAIHAKGTDYRPETLPPDEQAAHREFGIRVVAVGDPKTHASTDLIAAIRARYHKKPNSKGSKLT